MSAYLAEPLAPPLAEPLAEALRLLRRVPRGRAAVTRRAMPYIVPASHLVSGGRVLLWLAEGVEDAAVAGTVLAYQVDSCGCPRDGAGPAGAWAAQLIGTAEPARPTPAERGAFGAAPCPGAPERDGRGPGDAPAGVRFARLTPRFATVRRGAAGGFGDASG